MEKFKCLANSLYHYSHLVLIKAGMAILDRQGWSLRNSIIIIRIYNNILKLTSSKKQKQKECKAKRRRR